MKKLIIFLVRQHLKLSKYELFRFAGQKSSAMYYFTSDRVMKSHKNITTPSSVSLNWLLNPECEIIKTGDIIG